MASSSSSSSSSSSCSPPPPPSSSSFSSSSCDQETGPSSIAHIAVFPYPIPGHIRPLLSFVRTLAASYGRRSTRTGQGSYREKKLRITIIHTEANLYALTSPPQSQSQSPSQSQSQSPSPLQSPSQPPSQQAHHGNTGNATATNGTAHDDSEAIEDRGIGVVSISDGLPLAFDRAADHVAFFTSIQRMGPALVACLEKIGAGKFGPVACLVSDPNFPWIVNLARGIGLPCLLFVTDSASALAASLHARRLHAEGFIGIPGPAPDRRIDFIPGLRGLPAAALPFPPIEMSRFFFELRLGMYDAAPRAAAVLINTAAALEAEVLESIRISKESVEEEGGNVGKTVPVFAVGPCIGSGIPKPGSGPRQPASDDDDDDGGGGGDDDDGEDPVFAWLEKKGEGSVVYASFGTLLREGPSDAELREMGAALRSSKVSFVWAMKRPRRELERILGLVDDDDEDDEEEEDDEDDDEDDEDDGDGDGDRDEDNVREYRDRALLVDWAPQLAVLRHRAVGAFLTHCGWNSVLEASASAVPMICFPSILDQPISCHLVADVWRTGIRLDRGPELRANLASALSHLVPAIRPDHRPHACFDSIRPRCRELRRKLLAAMVLLDDPNRAANHASNHASNDAATDDEYRDHHPDGVARPDLIATRFLPFLDQLLSASPPA